MTIDKLQEMDVSNVNRISLRFWEKECIFCFLNDVATNKEENTLERFIIKKGLFYISF